MALEQTISVVIPLYNKRDYIVRTVESVLNQSYDHLELIIVNDGSTDDSLEQLNSLQDSRIKIITQANAGEGAARNKGLKAANHEWIAFLDADDSWEPDFLRCITQMLDAHPDIELCATGYKIRGPNDAETVGDLNASEFELQDNYFALSFENKLPFCASSVAIKRETLIACGGFAEDEAMGADQDLWCRLLTDRSFALHRYPHATYHQDASGRECNNNILRGELPFSARLQKRIDQDCVPEHRIADAKRYIAAHLLHVATLNLRQGDLIAASALLNDPRTRELPLKRFVKQAWLLGKQRLFRNGFIESKEYR